jgi:uncharacterized membrane protein YphA (DoxX/SURF4 family)
MASRMSVFRMSSKMDTFLIAAIVIVAALVTPLAAIWALNTLFGLAIAYTFKTWLAALVLGAILNPVVNVKKN